MKKILILLLLIGSTNVFAEWTRVFEAASNDAATVYVDFGTIKRKKNKVKMWTLLNYELIQGIVNQGNPFGEDRSLSYLSSTYYYLYDCEEETASVIEQTNYSGQMGSGNVIDNYFPNGFERKPVAPGSISEGLLTVACGKK